MNLIACSTVNDLSLLCFIFHPWWLMAAAIGWSEPSSISRFGWSTMPRAKVNCKVREKMYIRCRCKWLLRPRLPAVRWMHKLSNEKDGSEFVLNLEFRTCERRASRVRKHYNCSAITAQRERCNDNEGPRPRPLMQLLDFAAPKLRLPPSKAVTSGSIHRLEKTVKWFWKNEGKKWNWSTNVVHCETLPSIRCQNNGHYSVTHCQRPQISIIRK